MAGLRAILLLVAFSAVSQARFLNSAENSGCDVTAPINELLTVKTKTHCESSLKKTMPFLPPLPLNCNCTQAAVADEYTLKVQLTLPAEDCDALERRGHKRHHKKPHHKRERKERTPVIVFFHGFGGNVLLDSEAYHEYATTAASAGYAFVQYDVVGGITEGLGLVYDRVEAEFLEPLVDWLAEQDRQANSPAFNRLDTKTLYLAGHSRGGKLAALHLAAESVPGIEGAFLIDPVDDTCFAPAGECYPSAIEALNDTRADTSNVGIIGASKKGCCNPDHADPPACNLKGKPCLGNDYEDFANVTQSVNVTVLPVGHMQFAHLGFIQEKIFDGVCKADWGTTHAAVIRQAADKMVQFFDGDAEEDPLDVLAREMGVLEAELW